MKFARDIYSKTALLKSAYAFTDRAYVHLDADERYFYVCLDPKPGCERVSEDDFANEMVCQSVRHEVFLQTKTLRELLVARAMASTVIQGPGAHGAAAEALPADGDGSAGAGDGDDEAAAARILTDWFSHADV